jgi:hypothetical protein
VAAVVPVQPARQPLPSTTKAVYVSTTQDYYSCAQLGQLWDEEGGNPDAAYTAERIAEAESGGRVLAISPTSDYGLWQINWTHDPADPSKYLSAVVNVRAAIAISSDGTDWYPWTTYTSGAYLYQC